VALSPGVALFRTDATWPQRSDVTGLTLPAGGGPGAAAELGRIPTPRPALRQGSGTEFSGRVRGDETVGHSVTGDPGWELTVDGRSARRSPMLGWAQRFVVDRAGEAVLSWTTPSSVRGLQLVQVGSLALVLYVLARRRRLVPGSGRVRTHPAAGRPLVVVEAEDAPAPAAAPAAAGDEPGPGDASSGSDAGEPPEPVRTVERRNRTGRRRGPKGSDR
jgi:hypothetical protein